MTIKVREYQLLQDLKAEGKERADKLVSYQKAAESARSRLCELQTQYELVFSESVKKGKDATAQLDEINEQIELQKEIVARRDREMTLAYKAMPDTSITSIEVVQKYKSEFSDGVRVEFEEKVNPKLQLARDLILSSIDDQREYSSAYNGIYREINDMAIANHKEGKLREIMTQIHPIDNANIFQRKGAISGVRHLLEQVSHYTTGIVPTDYEYIEKAPAVKTNAKAGK